MTKEGEDGGNRWQGVMAGIRSTLNKTTISFKNDFNDKINIYRNTFNGEIKLTCNTNCQMSNKFEMRNDDSSLEMNHNDFTRTH